MSKDSMGCEKTVGKVLWWCDRDQNGIVLDNLGNEFYFDSSVLTLKRGQKIEPDKHVIFIPSKVDGLLAAKEVAVPLSKQKGKIAKRFEKEKNQYSLSNRP